MTITTRERLAEQIEDRRLELGLTWDEVATRGSTSAETLRQVRKGDRRIRPITRRAIEIGLNWPNGTVDRILAGEDGLAATTTTTRSAEPGHGTPTRRRAEEVADEIKGILDDPDLTEDEKITLAYVLMDAWERDERDARRVRVDRMRQLADLWKRARTA